ncbi:MAG TPA: hypothetical protein VIT65_14795 [Microlunatus sp.]
MFTPIRLASAPTALGAVILIAALAACSPAQGPTSPPTPGSSVSSTPDAGDVRGRLAAGLRDTSPANASLVENAKTTLTPVPATWLPGWQILDVVNLTPPHPRRLYAGLSDDGRALVLTGQPDNFSTMLTEAGVSVVSATVATDVAGVFLDATRDFVTLSYRVDGVDDIRWRPKLTAEQEKARDQVVSTYGDEVSPAKAVQAASGWTVTTWSVTGTDLVRHQVSLGADGTVGDKTEVVASDLPVPASL